MSVRGYSTFGSPYTPTTHMIHTTAAALLARPEAQDRRRLLDARKREVALGQVLAPHLGPATDALRPLKGMVLPSPARVTERVQGLLATLELARALPAFLSSKHVRVFTCGWMGVSRSL